MRLVLAWRDSGCCSVFIAAAFDFAFVLINKRSGFPRLSISLAVSTPDNDLRLRVHVANDRVETRKLQFCQLCKLSVKRDIKGRYLLFFSIDNKKNSGSNPLFF